ncbi:MAG TPA: heat-inducible transcriptional repressor HrcA [Vicinamibacterales bacterium]|nr:heat-inducible transcriptional repressor HrcA [Vicinamibacterales bacterium]
MTPDLVERQRRILERLITGYIEQGAPVSSAWLAEHSDLGLSSASVRTILARLEELGLVAQPHTSAGRVPTDTGYRQYVDGLLESRRRTRPLRDVEARLRRAGTVDDVLEDATQVLSAASQQIAFVLAPAGATVELRHIDFAPLADGRVLVIVVATGGTVTHKVVDLDEPVDATALAAAATYINREFAGRTIDEVRTALLERLQQERILYDALFARALRLARSGLSGIAPEETIHVQGTSFLVQGLLGSADDRDRTLEVLRALFRTMEQKHRLVELLTHYLNANGLTVVIGSEHEPPELRAFSVVASPFSDGRRSGTVGVIGPRRMRYDRAISAVDGVSRVMTRVLEGA